jgi:ADP-glucose pyrophosphorylase
MTLSKLEEMESDLNSGNFSGIGERCFISNALVEKNCRIGNDVQMEVSTLGYIYRIICTSKMV